MNASAGHDAVPNLFALRGDGPKMAQGRFGKTPHTKSMVFALPPNSGDGRENCHPGDQLIYVIEGSASRRVSGTECEIKAGDFVTIPAGAPHTLPTGAEKLFALIEFAPRTAELSDISDTDRSSTRSRRKESGNLTSALKFAIPVSKGMRDSRQVDALAAITLKLAFHKFPAGTEISAGRSLGVHAR